MTVVSSPSWPLRTLVCAGLLFLTALLVAIALLYPHSGLLLPVVLMAIFLAGSAVWIAVWGARPKTLAGRLALRLGAQVGLLTGLLWLVEIGFNNLLPPALSVPARDLVDNLFWLFIVLLLVVAASVGAWRTGRLTTGIHIGGWGGAISGLVAAIAGAALVVFGMPLLLQDPFTQAEWAQRGPSSGMPDLMTYVARDTVAGSVGHLVVLGVLMGLLLGVLGGALGSALAAWRKAGR